MAAYDASVAVYRLNVLTAFQQVEDNLAALRILSRRSGPAGGRRRRRRALPRSSRRPLRRRASRRYLEVVDRADRRPRRTSGSPSTS